LQNSKKSSSPRSGIIVAIIGIILIIAGGSYALYERYIVGGTRLSALAFNPIVDALGVVGVVLLIVGIALYYHMKNQRSATSTTTTTTQTGGASSSSKKPGAIGSKQTSGSATK
jgi:hypothetical protein